MSFDVDVYAELVSSLHSQGRHVICYMSAGSWEDERWLDIRNIDALASFMGARLDLCVAKRFDAIESDNIDGYTNKTGFSLTYAGQLRYNKWLADEAHNRGLSIGLKNDSDQVDDLIAYFDWELTEDGIAEGWCDDFEPFQKAGKVVFAAEYTDMRISLEAVISEANKLGLSAILKDCELDATRQSCGG